MSPLTISAFNCLFLYYICHLCSFSTDPLLLSESDELCAHGFLHQYMFQSEETEAFPASGCEEH